ncbi:glucose-1-phosphate cytidylyltransferase [Gammaproteobacteria bacterium]|jgi:glucose-1-phosphate cytidylyltransferase|nr:glucose-1-phosphate cytidylyltransferase [Gammaproteobacteria bacterium]
MKTVLLCGGMGTRLSEETSIRPKPMVEIGNRPMLWHIMKLYSSYNFNEFVLALGFKGDYIKNYFLNYHSVMSNISVDLSSGKNSFFTPDIEDWKVDLIDTGDQSLTGGRLLRLKEHLKDEDCFMLTYGDGLSNVNIQDLLAFHRAHGKIATVTAVRPPARFGGMKISNSIVESFEEKPQAGEASINGGFFVFSNKIFDYLEDDFTILESSPMENLAADRELMAYEHKGFWQCMDTVRDRDYLRELQDSGTPPWINDHIQ